MPTLKEKIMNISREAQQYGYSQERFADQILSEIEHEIERLCYEIFGEEEGFFWTDVFLDKLCPPKNK